MFVFHFLLDAMARQENGGGIGIVGLPVDLGALVGPRGGVGEGASVRLGHDGSPHVSRAAATFWFCWQALELLYRV